MFLLVPAHLGSPGHRAVKWLLLLLLLVGWQEEHLACKKHEWWDAGMVICLG